MSSADATYENTTRVLAKMAKISRDIKATEMLDGQVARDLAMIAAGYFRILTEDDFAKLVIAGAWILVSQRNQQPRTASGAAPGTGA